MSITVHDIEEAVRSLPGRYYSYDRWDHVAELSVGQSTTLTIDGEERDVKLIAEGSADGDSDQKWFVFQVDGRLFKKQGYFSSYDGSEWDGSLSEVRETQKLVTVYV